MAQSLIESMTAEFDPNEFIDNYRAALQEVIDAKVSGREVVAPEPAAERPAAVDLMAALKASVERAKAGRTAPQPATKPEKATKQERAATKAGKASTATSKPKRAPAKKAAKKTAARRRKSA